MTGNSHGKRETCRGRGGKREKKKRRKREEEGKGKISLFNIGKLETQKIFACGALSKHCFGFAVRGISLD